MKSYTADIVSVFAETVQSLNKEKYTGVSNETIATLVVAVELRKLQDIIIYTQKGAQNGHTEKCTVLPEQTPKGKGRSKSN